MLKEVNVSIIDGTYDEGARCVYALLRVPLNASITPAESSLATEIKKKIRSARKISCEFYLTEFISLMFGHFTSNVVFDFCV